MKLKSHLMPYKNDNQLTKMIMMDKSVHPKWVSMKICFNGINKWSEMDSLVKTNVQFICLDDLHLCFTFLCQEE